MFKVKIKRLEGVHALLEKQSLADRTLVAQLLFHIHQAEKAKRLISDTITSKEQELERLKINPAENADAIIACSSFIDSQVKALTAKDHEATFLYEKLKGLLITFLEIDPIKTPLSIEHSGGINTPVFFITYGTIPLVFRLEELTTLNLYAQRASEQWAANFKIDGEGNPDDKKGNPLTQDQKFPSYHPFACALRLDLPEGYDHLEEVKKQAYEGYDDGSSEGKGTESSTTSSVDNDQTVTKGKRSDSSGSSSSDDEDLSKRLASRLLLEEDTDTKKPRPMLTISLKQSAGNLMDHMEKIDFNGRYDLRIISALIWIKRVLNFLNILWNRLSLPGVEGPLRVLLSDLKALNLLVGYATSAHATPSVITVNDIKSAEPLGIFPAPTYKVSDDGMVTFDLSQGAISTCMITEQYNLLYRDHGIEFSPIVKDKDDVTFPNTDFEPEVFMLHLVACIFMKLALGRDYHGLKRKEDGGFELENNTGHLIFDEGLDRIIKLLKKDYGAFGAHITQFIMRMSVAASGKKFDRSKLNAATNEGNPEARDHIVTIEQASAELNKLLAADKRDYQEKIRAAESEVKSLSSARTRSKSRSPAPGAQSGSKTARTRPGSTLSFLSDSPKKRMVRSSPATAAGSKGPSRGASRGTSRDASRGGSPGDSAASSRDVSPERKPRKDKKEKGVMRSRGGSVFFGDTASPEVSSERKSSKSKKEKGAMKSSGGSVFFGDTASPSPSSGGGDLRRSRSKTMGDLPRVLPRATSFRRNPDNRVSKEKESLTQSTSGRGRSPSPSNSGSGDG